MRRAVICFNPSNVKHKNDLFIMRSYKVNMLLSHFTAHVKHLKNYWENTSSSTKTSEKFDSVTFLLKK